MKKTNLMKKVMMCFALVVMVCCAKGIVAQATEDVGTVIHLNEEVTGALTENNEVHWYKFYVEKRSVTSIVMGINSIEDLEKAEQGWLVTLYNEELKPIRKYSGIITQTTTPKIGLETGTYYVGVASKNSGMGHAPVDCMYSLIIKNQDREDWEIENIKDNENGVEATVIDVNKEYHGILYNLTDKDWYEVDVKNRGYIKLVLELNNIGDIDKVEQGWKVTLYDSNINPYNTYWYGSNDETAIIPVGTGKYYVGISARNSGSGYAPVDCEYIFKVKSLKSDKWESEWNNEKNIADRVSLNKEYKGNLYTATDKDWYKFTVSNTGRVTLKLLSKADPDNIKRGWNVYAYKGNKEIAKSTGVKSNATIDLKYLEKGTYYIKVCAAIESTSYSPNECTYNFKVNYSKKPSKATITSVTAGTKKATVKWKKVSNATGYYVYRATSKNGTYKKIATIKSNATVKYDNKSLKSGKTYYYKVRAYNKTNEVTAYGDYSSAKKIKVK